MGAFYPEQHCFSDQVDIEWLGQKGEGPFCQGFLLANEFSRRSQNHRQIRLMLAHRHEKLHTVDPWQQDIAHNTVIFPRTQQFETFLAGSGSIYLCAVQL